MGRREGILGASWEGPGGVLGVREEGLWDVLGRFCGIPGGSWGVLVESRGDFFRGSWGGPGGGVGEVPEGSRDSPGESWWVLGGSWSGLEGSGGWYLKRSWGGLLGASWTI